MEFLAKESKAWCELSPAEYDIAVCNMLDEIGGALASSERIETLLALASTALRRNHPILIDSRSHCADCLLALATSTTETSILLRIRLLLLLAWLQLGATINSDFAESISVTSALPSGVVLPDGAASFGISDPALCRQAQEIAKSHSDAAQRWNAKQRALSHLYRFAALMRVAWPDASANDDATKELKTAMLLMPGLPPSLRSQVEGISYTKQC